MAPTDIDAKTQVVKHDASLNHLENTRYFYQRALLDAVNRSAGILIAAIMIFKLKNSNV